MDDGQMLVIQPAHIPYRVPQLLMREVEPRQRSRFRLVSVSGGDLGEPVGYHLSTFKLAYRLAALFELPVERLFFNPFAHEEQRPLGADRAGETD